jgi:hypothetical protein
MTDFLEPAPFLLPNLLPEEERGYCNTILHQLSNVRAFIEAFDAALDLFDSTVAEINVLAISKPSLQDVNSDILKAHERSTKARQVAHLSERLHIAARDGATTLWQMLKSIVEIRETLNRAPTLLELARSHAVAELEAARRELIQVCPIERDVPGVAPRLRLLSESEAEAQGDDNRQVHNPRVFGHRPGPRS